MIEVNEKNANDAAFILREFLKPFDPSEVKLKPAMVKNNRCLALHYIDSRLVMDRLDEVVGVGGWQDKYTVLPSGEVECQLSVKIAGEWVTKADVGGQSEQPDEGDRMKAAYSDALKRAAVKFGIGRFLYRMPQQWMDYDPVKKQIVRPQQPVNYRQKYDGLLAKVASRADADAAWRQYDADVKAGRVNSTDKAYIDGLFKGVAAKFPKEPAKA